MNGVSMTSGAPWKESEVLEVGWLFNQPHGTATAENCRTARFLLY